MTQVEAAANKNRKAMQSLYESYKQKVFYIALLLSDDESVANETVHLAFREAFIEINPYSIHSEMEFLHLVLRKAVEFCKKNVLKHNSKAFRTPQDRNFAIVGESSAEAVSATEVLKRLPELQKFIFILHTIGRYSTEQVAATFKFDIKTVNAALYEEKANIQKVAEFKGAEAYDWLLGELKNGETFATDFSLIDANVNLAIDEIATPVEKKRKADNLKIIGIVAIVCVALLGIVAVIIFGAPKDTTTTGSNDYTSNTGGNSQINNSSENLHTPAPLDENTVYYADIAVKDYGTITVMLDQKSAPITAANFVELANSGFYNGVTFHRIMEGFMMQGGDPQGDGFGGSGKNIYGEFSVNGWQNDISHKRGVISMARSNAPNSASSQFFIVHEDSDFLDKQYAAFGYVTNGMEVVDAICESAQPTDDNGTIPAAEQPVMTSVTIRTE